MKMKLLLIFCFGSLFVFSSHADVSKYQRNRQKTMVQEKMLFSVPEPAVWPAKMQGTDEELKKMISGTWECSYTVYSCTERNRNGFIYRKNMPPKTMSMVYQFLPDGNYMISVKKPVANKAEDSDEGEEMLPEKKQKEDVLSGKWKVQNGQLILNGKNPIKGVMIKQKNGSFLFIMDLANYKKNVPAHFQKKVFYDQEGNQFTILTHSFSKDIKGKKYYFNTTITLKGTPKFFHRIKK